MNPSRSRAQELRRDKPRTWPFYLALVALVALLAFVFYAAFSKPPGTDQEQIIAMLEDIKASVARQDVSGVFSHVSPDFQFAGMNHAQARMQLLQLFRTYSATQVVFSNPQISVNGDKASVSVIADVTGTPAGTTTPSPFYNNKIQMDIVRGVGRRFVIFSYPKWQILKVTASGMPESIAAE